MNSATIKAKMKAVRFLKKAPFLPINLLSKLKVIMPTIVKVEIKAATWEYPAPFKSRVLPVEKATKVGIIVMEPRIADINTPKNPEEEPIIFEIVAGFKKARRIPMVMIMPRNWGIMFSKDFEAILIALRVLSLLLKKDIKSNKKLKEYKIIEVKISLPYI